MRNTVLQSVGPWEKGAKNDPDDVRVVQTLLAAAATEMQNPALDPGGIDGKIGKVSATSGTVKAIRAFQSTFLSHADALVEPGKATIKRLAASSNDQAGVVRGNMPEEPLAHTDAYCFPLDKVPRLDYRTGGRRFGASRSDGTRKHAGCDLIAPQGTPVFAVHAGTITRGPYYFYHGTYAIEVDHGSFMARYCEIKGTASGLRVGSEVSSGQLIAHVGQMHSSAMLHFELYSGSSSGPLTQNNPPYKRRGDLIDPTPYLSLWETRLPATVAH